MKIAGLRAVGAGVSLVLHSFFRSSTSFRVRVALSLKGFDYAQESHDFHADA